MKHYAPKQPKREEEPPVRRSANAFGDFSDDFGGNPSPNKRVQAMFDNVQRVNNETNAKPTQPKLTIGSPNDKYEQEADATAESVMSKPDPDVQKKSTGIGIQRKEDESLQRAEIEENENASAPDEKKSKVPAQSAFLQTAFMGDKEVVSGEPAKKNYPEKSFIQMMAEERNLFKKDDPSEKRPEKSFIQMMDDENRLSKKETTSEKRPEKSFIQMMEDEGILTKKEAPLEKKPEKSFVQRMAEEDAAKKVVPSENTPEVAKKDLLQTMMQEDAVNKTEEPTSEPIQKSDLGQQEEQDAVQTMMQEDASHRKEESTDLPIQLEGFVQREEEDGIQAKQEGNVKAANISDQLAASKGGGEPLPEETRSEMETRFGDRDFSNVRIHKDSRSEEMNKNLHSKAFANGSDVYFNTGQFDTGSTEGKKLLAHELTHTIQQGSSGEKIQTQLQDPVKSEDGEVPFKAMDAELRDELGADATSPPSAEEKAEGRPSDIKDQKKENQGEIEKEGKAKPPVDRKEENAPGIENNVEDADKRIEEEPKKEEPTEEEVVPKEKVELTKSQQSALLAQQALQAEDKIKTPKEEKKVKPPKLEPAVDADGQMLPINPTIARIPLIAAQIQAHREKAQELDEKATDEERFAEALRAGIHEIYSKIYDSNDYLEVVAGHAQERTELLDQTEGLIKVNEERTATVAKDAPEHVEGTRDTQKTLDTSVEKSEDQKSEGNSLNDPDMEEESKDNEEANAEVQDALEDTPEHAKVVADAPVKLIEDAEIAKVKHEEIKTQIATNRETVAKTEEDIRAKKQHNESEKAKLDTTVNEPDRIKKEAKEIQKEAKKMKKKSQKDEKQLHKTYDDYLSKMSSVPGLEKIDGKPEKEEAPTTPDFFIQKQDEDTGPTPGKLTDEEKQLYRENRQQLIENIDNDFDRQLIDQQMEMEDNFQEGQYWSNVWYGLKWSGLTIASMVSEINWIDAGLGLLLMVVSPYHLIAGTWDIVQKLLFPTIPENDPILMTGLRLVTSAVSIVAAIYGMLLGLSVFGFVASFALSFVPFVGFAMAPWVIFFKFAMGLYGGLFAWYLAASAILHAAVYLLDLHRAGVQDSAKGLQEQSNQLSNDIDQASFSVTALLFMKALNLGGRFTRGFGGNKNKKGGGSKNKKGDKGGKNEELLEKEAAKNEKELKENNSNKEKTNEGEEVVDGEVTTDGETKLGEGKVKSESKKVEEEGTREKEVKGKDKKEYKEQVRLRKAKLENEIQTLEDQLDLLEKRWAEMEKGKTSAIEKAKLKIERNENVKDDNIKNLIESEAKLTSLRDQFTKLKEQFQKAETKRQLDLVESQLEMLKTQSREITLKNFGDHGLTFEHAEALRAFERLMEDPIGDINSHLIEGGGGETHNHYRAARIEARNEIIKQNGKEIVKKDGTPYSHIRDLQNAYNSLQNIKASLMKNRSKYITEDGTKLLDAKIAEVNRISSKLKGFLDGIGWPPSKPHAWENLKGKWVGKVEPPIVESMNSELGKLKTLERAIQKVTHRKEKFAFSQRKIALEKRINELIIESENNTNRAERDAIKSEFNTLKEEIKKLEKELK